VEREERGDRFTALEDKFAGYEVYDQAGEKIGKVDNLFIEENANYESVGVKTGLLGTKTTLIPWQVIQLDDEGRRMVVSTDKDRVQGVPAFDKDERITPDSERQVYEYFGLQTVTGYEQRGAYDAYRAARTTDTDEVRIQRSEEEPWAGTREHEATALFTELRGRYGILGSFG
jgi:hypothetical protein